MELRHNNQEIRSNSNGISGYGLVFWDGKQENQYPLGDNRFERMPNDMNVIIEPDLISTFNHNVENLLGRQRANNLEARMDERGLFYRIKPSDTSLYRDLQQMIARGDVFGSSIAFLGEKKRWLWEGKTQVRYWQQIRVAEV